MNWRPPARLRVPQSVVGGSEDEYVSDICVENVRHSERTCRVECSAKCGRLVWKMNRSIPSMLPLTSSSSFSLIDQVSGTGPMVIQRDWILSKGKQLHKSQQYNITQIYTKSVSERVLSRD